MAKMNYWLELYNVTNATRQGQLVYVDKPNVILEIMGENRLEFDLSEEDPLFDTVSGRFYVRMVNSVDKSYRSFIIQEIISNRDKDGRFFKSIRCEGLKYALIDNVVPDNNFYANITMTDALTIALTGSGFTVGTVDSSADTDANRRSIQFNWPNSLEALQMLIDTWDYDDSGTTRKYLYIINENKTIDIREYANAGSLLDFYIHPHKQMNGMTKSVNVKGTVNRAYGIGKDGFTFYRSGRNDYDFYPLADQATGPGSGNDTLADTVNINTDELHTGLTIGLRGMTGGSGADEKKTITGESATSHEFKVNSVWSTNPSASDDYKTGYLESGEDFTYEFGAYVSDSNSLAKNSQVILDITFDSNPSTATGTSTFIVRTYLQNSGGSNVRVAAAHKEIQLDISSEDSTDVQIILNVAEWTDISELYVKFQSHAYSTGAGTPFIRASNIRYVTGRNADYVEDTGSIGSIGTIEGKYENPDIWDTVNLLKTPALDGTYSAGLCENWTKVGSPTVSENTNSNYYHHGGKSQKVVAAAVDEGISQIIGIKSEVSYSAYVRVYIDPADIGSVIFKIEETGLGGSEWEEVINAGGWVEVTVENFSISPLKTQIKVSVLSIGEDSTFYVDAVMVHEGPEIHPFVDGDSADILYAETLTFLKENKDPATAYELDMINLYEVDRGKYPEEDFNEYDRVRVVDIDLNLDSHFMVARKEFDMFKPEEAKVTLENKREYFRKSFLKALLQTTALNRR